MSVQPTILAGNTLPHPVEYSVDSTYVGGSVVLASGALRRDLLSTVPLRRFTLSWVGLTSAQFNTISAAYHSAVLSAVNFVGPDGASATVTAGQRAALRREAYRSAGELRWRCSIELWEAP